MVNNTIDTLEYQRLMQIWPTPDFRKALIVRILRQHL